MALAGQRKLQATHLVGLVGIVPHHLGQLLLEKLVNEFVYHESLMRMKLRVTPTSITTPICRRSKPISGAVIR